MKATILSIGDELLIGQTINTNASWLSVKMNEIGVDVIHQITLSDDAKDIITCLDNALQNSQLVLITGGLGPTSDDITKDVLCNYFGGKLVFNEIAFANIEKIFELRKRLINEETKQVAFLPNNCLPLQNRLGTAAGMLFKQNKKIIISMPGVPYEMKAMIENDVIPFLKIEFNLPTILHSSILCAGVGETQLADKLKDFEKNKHPKIKLAYLPNVGKVRLRLTIKGENKSELEGILENAKTEVLNAIGNYVYGFDNDILEENIGKILTKKKLTIACAESCSGGYISHLFTSISGSSAYFKGAIIAYDNAVKKEILNVSEQSLDSFGAVSEQVVSEMLDGVFTTLKTDIAIAVSGIAGPNGGSIEKPVGTVIIGVANNEKKYIKLLNFTNNRERNIQLTGVLAMVLLQKFLNENYS